MSTRPRFCSQCGKPLRESDRFCGHCGQAVLAPPDAPPSSPPPPDAPPPPAAQTAPAQREAAPGEPILGIIPALQKRRGFLGLKSDTYNLIITPQRLILAYIAQPMINQAIKTAREEAKSQGKGFFGQAAAQMGWINIICRDYYAMPAQAIPTRYPGSLVIPLAQVTKVRLKQPRRDDEQPMALPQMHIETLNGKYRFELRGMSFHDARRLLKQLLPQVTA